MCYITYKADPGTFIEIIYIPSVNDPYTVILLCWVIWDLAGSLFDTSGGLRRQPGLALPLAPSGSSAWPG